MAVAETGPRVQVRMIVEGGEEVAQRAVTALAQLLTGLSIDKPVVKPYWKFPNTFEIVAWVRPSAPECDALLESVKSALGVGWSPASGDAFASWSVWNRGDGPFNIDSVFWAHAELMS